MTRLQHNTHPSFTQIRRQFRQRVSHLIENCIAPVAALEAIVELEELLQSLPLATADYHAARNRLRSAARYFRSNESGAARYELRLVLGHTSQNVR